MTMTNCQSGHVTNCQPICEKLKICDVERVASEVLTFWLSVKFYCSSSRCHIESLSEIALRVKISRAFLYKEIENFTIKSVKVYQIVLME